ncbi:MAG: metallophosphoesterase family protein [Candidatus Xenobia bacterium]
MKIVHLSDTHLGLASGSRLHKPTGLNAREHDMLEAFTQAVNRILQIRPHAVLHAGDLFDAHHPSNRTLSFAMRQLRRLTDADIPFVALAGNTSTPRQRDSGSVFEVLELMPGVHTIFGSPKSIKLGSLTVHGVPHADATELEKNLADVHADAQAEVNIVLLHTYIPGIAVRSSETNPAILDDPDLSHPGIDYYALGDSHRYAQLQDNAHYSGALEHIHPSEADGTPRGMLVVDFDALGTPEWIQFEATRTRPMRKLPLNLMLATPEEATAQILRALEAHATEGAVVWIDAHISPEVYYQLDVNRLRERYPKALEIRIQPLFQDTPIEPLQAPAGSLRADFVRFVAEHAPAHLEADWLVEQGLRYLGAAEEDAEAPTSEVTR